MIMRRVGSMVQQLIRNQSCRVTALSVQVAHTPFLWQRRQEAQGAGLQNQHMSRVRIPPLSFFVRVAQLEESRPLLKDVCRRFKSCHGYFCIRNRLFYKSLFLFFVVCYILINEQLSVDFRYNALQYITNKHKEDFNMEYWKDKLSILMNAIFAGFSIGLGGLIYLSVDNKVVGSLLFGVGLFLVCTMGFNLYTGKICFVTGKTHVFNYVLIWFGNFVGAWALAQVVSRTRLVSARENAINLCNIKMNDSYASLMFLGVICNIFIFIAVYGYKKISDPLGKYLAIFLGVMGFILVGSEHCVADMFYFCMADMISVDMLLRLLMITLGNSIGGIVANQLIEFCDRLVEK